VVELKLGERGSIEEVDEVLFRVARVRVRHDESAVRERKAKD
jgi:hypothetical protein